MTIPDLIGVSSLLAVIPLLASCASSGLYNMSDEWCARHLDATAAHCPQNQDARALAGNPGPTLTSDARAARADQVHLRDAAQASE
jgi:hypothetical protein